MAKWQDEFEALKRDPSHWDTLPPNMRKSLRTRGLVNEAGQVIEIEPEQTDAWRVQTWVKAGEKDDWVDQVSPTGEKMVYDTQEEAEKNARQLSLLNYRAFRVCLAAVAGSFVVYEFGLRYIEDGVTHVRTRIEPDIFAHSDQGESSDLYRIESRRAYTPGAVVTWETPAPRDYLDLESAVTAALEISKANPRREYRIVLAETRLSPEAVVYRGGDAFPNVDDLQAMCQMINPGDTAEALRSLLVLWKGEKPAHNLIREMFGKVNHA